MKTRARTCFIFPGVALCIFSFGGASNAQDRHDEMNANPLGLFANVDAGYSFRRNFQSNSADESVTYLAQNFSVLDLSANAGMLGQSFFTSGYQRGFSKGGFQQTDLSTDIDEKQGLERFRFGIILDPLLRLVAPDYPLVRMLLSLRFRYVHETTQTEAVVNENSIYLPAGALVDYANHTAATYTELPAESFYFLKTSYSYSETTIRFPINYGNFFGAIRLGYAQWEYRRPFSTRQVHLNNLDVIYDGEPRVGSIVLVFESVDEGSPGFHLDGTLSLGVDNIFNSSLDWHRVYEFGQPGTEVQYNTDKCEINVWYNLYLSPEFAKGLFFRVGGSISGFEFNILQVETSGNSNQVLTKLVNGDIFGRLSASISVRF